MNGAYQTKRYAADKVALLALFIIAVLIAYFVTARRLHVYLSGPIRLDCADLSVSIPVGDGWQGEKQWQYQQNGFTLSSIFTLSEGGELTLVRCRYLLAAEPESRFGKKASKIGGSIVKTGQINTGKLIFQWAHIEKEKTLLDIFLGIAQMPNDRRLDIEVRQVAGDSHLAEQLFKRIIESVKAQDNKLLSAGSEIVEQIKNKGIKTFLNSYFQDSSHSAETLETQIIEDFFLVKDQYKRPLGFVMETLSRPGRNKSPNIQAAGLYYLKDSFPTQ